MSYSKYCCYAVCGAKLANLLIQFRLVSHILVIEVDVWSPYL